MFLLFLPMLPLPPGAFSRFIDQQVKIYYVKRNALSMFKALNKGFKLKYAVLLLNHIDGGLNRWNFNIEFFPD